ncbi:MAG: M1 family aminopeptidase [Chitinophagaceae bacterium]
MLSRVLSFELKYHFSQTVFRIALLIFFLLGLIAVRGSFGNDVLKNSPYVIMNITGLLSLCSIFSGTLFCANVVLRDKTYRIESMLLTTSISKRTYFITRFAGLFLSVMISLVFTSLGMIAGCFLLPSVETGSFNLLHYLYAIIIIGIPNILFCCTILFSAAILSSNIRFVYASGVLLYVFYWTGSILGNSPLLANADPMSTPGNLALIADPFGLSIFFSETKHWTSAQKNTLLLVPKGVFLINRLVWTAISLLALVLTFRSFRFELKLQGTKKEIADSGGISTSHVYRSAATSASGFTYLLGTFRSQVKLETISLFRHIPFMVMMIVWIFIYAVELKDMLLGGIYHIRSFPDTSIIIEQFAVIKPALVLIIFYAAELAWRERSANMHPLIYSSPVRNIILWGAKLTCLAILIAFVITANIGIGIGLQTVRGFSGTNLADYLKLYYYTGIPLLMFAVLILFIVTVFANKYLGILVATLTVAVILFSTRLGIEHYLLRYASSPELIHSAMNGFGRNSGSFNWYMLYCSGYALLLSVGSIGLWQNSRATGFRQRLSQLKRQFRFNTALPVFGSILIIVLAGGWIYHQTNIIGGYKSRDAKLQWQIGYEKKYKPKALTVQPVITKVTTEVDLYPSSQRYTIRGNYQIKNESDLPMSSIWLGIDPSVTSAHFTMADATLSSYDAAYGQYEYSFTNPVKPGDVVDMSFSMEIIRSGFTSFDVENNVAPNGTYIELEKFLPYFGYNDRYETDDKAHRLASNLPEKAALLPPDTLYHLVNYQTTISIEGDQKVVSVGSLKQTWKKDDRTFYAYESEKPIPFMFAISAAKYEVMSELYDDVKLELYYHQGHEANTAAMFQGMKDALNYCRENFGNYPFSSLRMAEIPQYGGAATAYPGLIFNAERINYLGDYRDSTKINHAYTIAAHETAHQWWGTQLQTAASPGNKILTESLAKYTENMVLQKRFGQFFLRNYLADDSRLYFTFREFTEDEHTMDTVTGQPFVYYQKGGIGMYALQESFGEQRLNSQLKKLLDSHSSTGIRAATNSLEQLLLDGSTDEQRRLVTDLFKRRVTWELSIDHATTRPLAGGQYELICHVSAKKMDGSFHSPKEMPVRDSIEVVIFDDLPAHWSAKSTPIYRKKTFFTSIHQTVRIVVDRKPLSVSVDPFMLMLDGDRSDNVKVLSGSE